MSFAWSRRLWQDRGGAVLAEFGFTVPILIVILLGCYDAARYVLIHQKLDRVATAMADLVARAEGISAAQIDDLFVAAEQLAQPYDIAQDGGIVISSVYRPTSGDPQVAWQRSSSGSLTTASRIGTAGSTASLPDGFVVRAGENVIIAEVWFNYSPRFTGILFKDVVAYHSAYNRPRVINLTTCDGCS